MASIEDLIADPLGVVYPHRASQPLPDLDARTHALRRLREFLSVLDLRRTNFKGGEAIKYRIPIANIHIEQPDSVEDLKFPGVGMLPGKGSHLSYGLGGPKIIDDTIDLYAPGTALACLSDYSEQFILELWASQRAERRSLMAGIGAALRASETSYAIKLTLPDYFGQVASFSLDNSQPIDDPDVVRGRRRAHLTLTLTIPEVRLVNVERLRPLLAVEATTEELPTTVAEVVAWGD